MGQSAVKTRPSHLKLVEYDEGPADAILATADKFLAGEKIDLRLFIEQVKVVVQRTPPPHDLDAEAAVLADMLLCESGLLQVFSVVRANDFYSDSNRRIFEACKALFDAGTKVDIVTVGAWLREREWINQIGGSSYLVQLVDATPSVANMIEHAKIVALHAQMRRVIATCQRIAAEGYSDVGDRRAWLASASEAMATVAAPPADDTRSDMRGVMVAAAELLAQYAAAQGEITGVRFPSESLNCVTGGMVAATATFIGGFRGAGKTSWMIQTAIDCACSSSWEQWVGDECQIVAAYEQGLDINKPPDRIRVRNAVLIFSIEDKKDLFGVKMQCTYGRVNFNRIKTGRLQDSDWGRLTTAAVELAVMPIEIDDEKNLRMVQIRARTARVRDKFAKFGRRLRLVCVDHLHLVETSDLVRNQDETSIERLYTALGNRVKDFKKLDEFKWIAWMWLVQLNEKGAARGSKALEEAVDLVGIIKRERTEEGTEAQVDSTTPEAAKVLITKQRGGADNRFVKTMFHGWCGVFSDDEQLNDCKI